MDRYFYVDSINQDKVRLEDINTSEILEVYDFILPSINEGDYLLLKDGIFSIDNSFKEEREEELMKKFLEVSND